MVLLLLCYIIYTAINNSLNMNKTLNTRLYGPLSKGFSRTKDLIFNTMVSKIRSFVRLSWNEAFCLHNRASVTNVRKRRG